MSHSNFGRGRSFGLRGSRAISSFGRLRFLRPPFRHAGPPRPSHHGSFGMPWQPNMIFQPQLHGNLQFRPGGRRRRICSYDIRFPPPNRLPIPSDCEEVALSSLNNPQLEDNETCTAPQIPLPGSEEERQQKIAKTADRLKQKLSSFNSDEVTNIWTDDISLPSVAENDRIESRTFEQCDLNLTHNDLKDIGRINFDNSKFDMQDMTDTCNVIEDTSINVISSENKSSIEMISNDQVTNVENLQHQENPPHDSSCIETEQWNPHEMADNSENLEQTDLQDTDINTENQLVESDIQSQYNISPINVLQDQHDQQDISQEIEINPKNLKEQNISKTSNSQNTQLSIVSIDQDVLQNDMLRETELVANLEIQENVLNSHIYAKSLSNNNSTSQPAPCNMPVLNNVGLDNRLSRIMENSFHSGPPRLSPHIEQELPIDFDPSTPPPILMKQDQPVNALPPLLIHDLPPLFNPTKPPPNMRIGLKLPHENPTPTWNINTQNQVPAVYNTEVHMDLNTHVGFTPQQLPLEMASQSNVFLAPPIDPMNFSPLFPMPPSNHPIINTNVPLLPQEQIVPQNIRVPPSSPQESLSFSDCNVNKDDVLNEMQEAMKFAQQMTNITESIIENTTENITEDITEKDDEKSKSDSTFLSESCTSVNPINNVEFISLPPGKPKIKPVKLKRIKRDDMHRKKFKLPEEQKTSDNIVSDEIIIQDDANIKFKDVSIVNEQDRPKVIFNLNNKTIKVNNKTAWQETRGRKREKKNCMRQPAKSETMRTTSSVIRKNLISIPRRKEEKKSFKKNEKSINRIIPSETIALSQNASSHKKIQRIHKEKSRRSNNISSYSRTNVHKSKNMEENESSSSEISWKNNVINRFLKMSRNDIYNMVNNTSLRKFDVIMKRLVKEQKATLSLKMRHVQDEKMKLYDQQEFMKQLNAMLDTDATVSITDLPTEFIHHLNEVLQLDVQQDNQDESAASLASQNSHLEETSHVLDSVTIAENETTMTNIVNEENIRNRSHVKSIHDKNVQIYSKINDFNVKDDTCSTVISNKSSISSKLSALQHDLDDIFSEVTKKNHAPIATMRKDCIIGQRSAKRLDNDASSKNMQKEAFLEDDRVRRSENCARWIEKCDKWKKKEREDPYTYRNLTKEEWEAKYGTQTSANAISSFPAIASSLATSSAVPSSSTIISFPTKIIDTCNKSLPNKAQDENSYPRRRHSSESSKHSSMRYRIMEKDKHNKRSRRHSDDKKHGLEYSEDNGNSSPSNSSNTSSDSSDSDREPNVTKLLRVIKENEKVAKKMSLNEAIRDEVNAEIERERRQKSKKSRKNRKNAKRKAKRARHKKKKKQSKKMSTSSDSSSDKDNNEETIRLLTETEIKKEIVEDLIQQEVIIKEELDIGQEENIEDTEFTNMSDRMEPHNYLASPLAQETLLTTANTIKSYNEDKQSTASPTQPKTKAQLKQMPADMNDNKVPLNIFTTIPESLIMGDISENLKKTREEINCDQNITKVSLTINNLTNQSDATNDTVQASHVKPNENTIPQMDAIVHNLTDLSSINIQNEISVSPKISLISDVSSINDITQKQEEPRTSKKIDIKTYYERTIQRRMNEQGGSKKSMKNSAVSKQNSLFIQKSTEMETVINKSAHDNSVQNPRSNSLAKLTTYSTNSKDSISQIVLGENIQKEQEQVKESKLAEKILEPKEDSNRIKNDNDIKKIDQYKLEKKAAFIAKTNVNAFSNNRKCKTISKFKKHSKIETNITEQKLQTKIPLDPKKFKNIRSEGSKELKLKKEMAKTLKARKKSGLASKSDLDKSYVSKKERYLKNTKRTEDIEKIKCIKHKDTEETVSNSAHERLLSKITLNVISNTTDVEIENKKDEDAKEISPKLDVSTSSKIVSIVKASGDNGHNNEDFLISNQIRSSNAKKDAELSLNPENQVRKSDNKDLKESMNVPVSIAERDVSSIPESDISRSDNVDTQGKDIHLLINTYTINNIEINDTNENNMESDILANTYTSANAEEGGSVLKKTVELSSTSNKNCKKQQGIVEAVTSPDSIGSPFKGFLQESIMAFEQPNLFNLELNEIDGGKKIKLFLDGCNVNYVTHVSCVNDVTHDTYKEIEIEKQHHEILDSVTDYANDMNVNANQTLNIAFTSPLFTLDKEPMVNEKSDVMPDESKERTSSDEAITSILHDENNDIRSGAEEQLENEKNYTLNTELTIKESMFIINEEEIIQDETQPKDLTDKLTTTTDPSLSDAVDTAISDDPLRLPDSQSTDNLNNHVYLETNLSTEKTSCDKLPDFESEHLVNDMFYLDDRLQDTTEFDNKDDVPSHFSIHQQSPQYDITPTVIPEVTMITPDTDLSHDEIQKSQQMSTCEFNFDHISSVDNDCNLLTKTSTEHSPLRADSRRTLNIPTKAALKEAAADLFLKSPDNVLTVTDETTRILEKSQQNKADLNYRTSTWHPDVHDKERYMSKSHNNMTITQDSVNVNTISSTQNNMNGHSYEASAEQNKSLTSVDIEKHSYNIQRNPVVELQKMKGLDGMLKNRMLKNSEKFENSNYKEQKKRKHTILHKIKHKQSTKYRSNKNENLVKELKKMKQSGNFSGNTKEAILARMLKIDMEMHKLMMEKLKLYKVLQNNSSIENTKMMISSTVSKTKNDNPISVQQLVPSVLTSELIQNTEMKHKQDKCMSSSKRSLIKQKKRMMSPNLEDDEIIPYTQRSKTPLIKWKKKPRLELTTKEKRKENEEGEEEAIEKTTKQTSIPSVNEKADSLINAFENIIQEGEKLNSNVITQNNTQEEEIDTDINKKVDDNADKYTICLNKSAEKNIENNLNSHQNSTEIGGEYADSFNINKTDNIPIPNETIRANFQPKSIQIRNTPEPLSIYSDDSTWDSLVQNTVSEMHENRKSTGLALLDEALKKEQAMTKKMKAIARKKKKKQLNNFLKTVDNLTLEEEELPLSKLLIKKLQQKRDLLDSLSQRKEDLNIADPKILKNVDEVINAVAENRVEDLYEHQLEARANDIPTTSNVSIAENRMEDLYEHQLEVPAPNDIPTTSNVSNVSIASQSDKQQFYIDVEANANADWACQEKEDINQVILQQDSNDIFVADVSNHVFKVVSQNKVSFYDENNVEPDSSVTPEETLMENHSLDLKRVNSKDPNNAASRNFDIKVSVPTALIKNDFGLELLQKFKNTDVNIAGTGLVDSTTNTFSTNIEKSKKNDKNLRCDLQTKSLVEKDKDQIENTMKLIEKDKSAIDDDKQNICEQKLETTMTDNIENAELDTIKPGYFDITGSEDSGDSIGSNQYDKITDIAHDSNASNSIIEKVDTKEGKSDAESESLNDTIVLRQNQKENITVTEEERNNIKSKSHMFEESLDKDQNTDNTILADRTSEKSEESNEMSIAQKSDLENISISTFCFNKIIEKAGEANKKLRRKSDKLTPIRRSIRYINDNIKSKMNEMDTNSNSSELESNEKDLIIRHGSKSPIEMLHDERNINNTKKNRLIQKEQNTSIRKASIDFESETRIENPVKSCFTEIAESTVSKDTTLIAKKRKHTLWQMMYCKVRVIDCKHTLLKPDVHPEVLNKFGIIAINPYLPNNTSYMQHIANDKEIVTSVAILEKSSSSSDKFCDKDKTEIEILEEKSIKKNNDNDFIQESASHVIEINEQEPIRTQYTVHKGPILDIKIFDKSFLAASEDGKIYRYSQTSNEILNIYEGHKSAVTCLHIYKSDIIGINKELMYSGSLDGTLRCYDIISGDLMKKPAQINSPIQCMDQAWSMIFVGTKSGHVLRFNINKSGAIKGSGIQFSDNSVLALKATNEGPRKILIVASRSQAITIRDAMNGLFLRTINKQRNHTVYSLMRHHNLIYCGTSSTSINVFNFITGEQVIQYEAGVGIVCMRLYAQLLFAGCYDGNIYVFDTNNHKLVCSIRGPGNMLLSLEVVNNKIIAGTKDKRLHSWQMPNQVRALLKKIS